MAKKKSKLKKVLRNLGVGAALLGAGKALMSRRDKANQMKEFLATEGGDISILPKKKRFINIDGRMAAPIDFDANPREIADMVKSYGFDTSKPNMGMPIPTDKTLAGDYGNAFDIGLKKGGRVRKTKKGGRAVRKANRSKKK
tara:strand:- start:124 stop:549 length:426 start_codon:yes stop_codon:yes gene_type:complete